jgi:CCR4-NOT transcriptional complex subunit CAF120
MQSTYSESTNPNHTSRPDQSREISPDADAYADAPPLATPLSDDDDGSRLNSLQDAFIDHEALERMLDNDRTDTMHSATSTEPDYASTVSSNHEERTPVERPRAGKLKTVGNPDLAQHDPKYGRNDTWQHEQAVQKSSVPNINFGPTYIYKPTGRPGTSGTIGPAAVDDRNRSGSTDRLRSSGRMTPGGISPVENYRQSYFGGVPDADNSRTHSRNQSVAWTPSGGSPGHQQRQSLTPEQWVQQRAAMAAQPHYPPQGPAIAHQRTGSSGSFNVQQLRKTMTKTPPPFARARTPSGDWTNMVQDQRTPPSRPHSRGASMHLNTQPLPPSRPHSRSASTHLNNQPAPPSRPLSRSAGMYLNQPTAAAQQPQPAPPSRPLSRSAGVYLNPPSGFLTNPQSTNLSAREQMHVARATGTPLLDTVATTRKKKQQEDDSLGLVGAIGAREREKAAMKAGHRSSMVVENAIRARQDQQAEAQMLAYQQQMVQQQQQAAYYAQQQQQQQQAAYYAQQQQPQAAGYGNGYGYGTPGTPGTQYGHGVQLTPLQMQQQNQSQIWQQQQQQQGAQTPGNRQSWFAGSYFGGLPPQ